MRKTSARLDRRQFIALGGAAATSFAMPSLAKANAWPTKPVKILAGSAAGGQTDQFSRIYGEYISREIGQPVVVENKSGAGGAIAAVELKRSEPDGHTWMIATLPPTCSIRCSSRMSATMSPRISPSYR